VRLKTLAVGVGVLVLLTVAGVLIQRQLDAPPAEGRVGKPLLEQIDMSEAASIVIDSGEDKVNLLARDGSWIVKEQDGFPASEEAIRRFLFKLSGQEIQHKVTENPKKLAGLGLLSLEENDNKFEERKTATRFAIVDGDGKPIYELLIGNDRAAAIQGLRTASAGGQYVRFSGEQAAYLIPEPLLIDTKPHDWLKRKVFTFDDDKLIKSIRITQPGAKDLVFTRKDGESDWKLAGVPADRLNKNEATLLSRRLRDLEIVKVAPKGKPAKELGRGKVGVATVELFDQRSYRVEVGTEKTDDNYRFITVTAALDATVTDQALKQDVDDLNALFAKRVLAVYNWDGEQLLKKKEDFIEEKK
jgi:hypothetical protein